MTHANRFVGSKDREAAALRSWEKFYPRASGEMIVAFDSAARLKTIAVARDSQSCSGRSLVSYRPDASGAFADYSHFTDLGAAVTAAYLGAFMGRSGTAEVLRFFITLISSQSCALWA